MIDEPITRDEAFTMARLCDLFNDPRVEQHLASNRHSLTATRAVLDLIGIPLPNWATRNISGRASVTKAAMDRFRADNPQMNLPRGYVPKTRCPRINGCLPAADRIT